MGSSTKKRGVENGLPDWERTNFEVRKQKKINSGEGGGGINGDARLLKREISFRAKPYRGWGPIT